MNSTCSRTSTCSPADSGLPPEPETEWRRAGPWRLSTAWASPPPHRDTCSSCPGATVRMKAPTVFYCFEPLSTSCFFPTLSAVAGRSWPPAPLGDIGDDGQRGTKEWVPHLLCLLVYPDGDSCGCLIRSTALSTARCPVEPLKGSDRHFPPLGLCTCALLALQHTCRERLP